ncbi:hypothetical protein AOB60_29285 [Streptomyces noursei]|uniref:Uncharacterized protein n=1 Tax=Streptomyces noursei TaxID=1971 RepID=A0A2N8PAZ1_STRNR|nr:hypothetical protein AOB60_29285 [Streptomyces noursei]
MDFGPQVGADRFFVTEGIERDGAKDMEADGPDLPGTRGGGRAWVGRGRLSKHRLGGGRFRGSRFGLWFLRGSGL